MKSRNKIIALLLSCAVIISTLYLYKRFSYAKEQEIYISNYLPSKTLTVGIIGDSWVYGDKLDGLLHEKLTNYGLDNLVISSGQCGANTKLIYQNLFKEKQELHSSKFIIESKPDYCVIVAGVNDSAGQLGPSFYSYHMIEIVKLLLRHNIHPIMVELPEFGIIEAISKKGFIRNTKDLVFSYFTNSGEIDNIITYRKTLYNDLIKADLLDNITLVPFDEISVDYSKNKNLYQDVGHLSEEGNKKLTNSIAKAVIKLQKENL